MLVFVPTFEVAWYLADDDAVVFKRFDSKRAVRDQCLVGNRIMALNCSVFVSRRWRCRWGGEQIIKVSNCVHERSQALHHTIFYIRTLHNKTTNFDRVKFFVINNWTNNFLEIKKKTVYKSTFLRLGFFWKCNFSFYKYVSSRYIVVEERSKRRGGALKQVDASDCIN